MARLAEEEARRGKFESGHRDACQASLLYCGTGAPLTLGRGRVHAIFVACVPSARRMWERATLFQPAQQGRTQPSTLARPDPCCFERARARSLYLVGLHLLKKFCTGELRVCKQALYGLGKFDLCERR